MQGCGGEEVMGIEGKEYGGCTGEGEDRGACEGAYRTMAYWT